MQIACSKKAMIMYFVSGYIFSHASNKHAFQAGPGLFKVATLSTWMVLPTNSELVDDIRKASEEILSHAVPTDEVPTLLVG